MQIHLSPSDGVPIYLQIVNQVRLQLSAGRLQEGDELPAIRTLAERLLINPNTVVRAYRELEALGIVEKRRTNGTFISAAGSPLALAEKRRLLAERADALLAEAHQMGFPLDDLLDLIRERSLQNVEVAP